MTDTIRCPHCFGAKQVMKLGGIMGNCNTCKGKGTILESDKPKPIEISVADVCAKELINAVADCVPASNIEHKASIETLPKEVDVKVDGKKALYKRKTTAK